MTPSRRPPPYVWTAWGLFLLDLIGLFMVLAGFRSGPARGEGALGCLATTGIMFIPLLASALLSTLIWRRSQLHLTKSQSELKAKARDIRNRGSGG